jgi:hypothetical protein
MQFIIINGLPYLYANGKAYKCRFDEAGFTPTQEEVELTEKPNEVFSELEIKAQCACLDSIDGAVKETECTQSDENGEVNEEVVEAEKAAENADFNEFTLNELKEYAKEHEIKLGTARTKAEIIEKITAIE